MILSCNIKAQRVYKYNAPGSDCYSEMVFEEKAVNPKGVIVVDCKGAEIISFSQNNPYINSGLFINYNFLYVNILNKGSSTPLSCYSIVISTISGVHRIYPSSFYVILNESDNNGVVIQKTNSENYPFNIIYASNTENEKLLHSIDASTKNQTYKIPMNVSFNSEHEHDIRMKNYKRNFDIGVYLSPTFLSGNKLGINKKAVTNYGLSIAKNIGSQFTIKANFGGSFKKPDQGAIQSGMQSKVMAAVQAGDSLLIIDETISGHIMFGGDLNFKYYFEKSKPFRPFISAGIGSYNITNISGRIQDTMDVSNIDMSNPSSMQSAIGGSSGSSGSTPAGMSNNSYKFFVPQFEAGFEFRLAPIAKINISVPFKYFIDKSNNLNTFTWGLNFGLSFTINPGNYPNKLKVKKTK